MAKPSNPPLDEIQFRRPDVLAYWGGVHTDSVHGYIKESPFFDHTSKNGLLWDQGFEDPRTFQLCANRQQFENTLRSRPGLEFMVTGEPQPSTDPAAGPDTGVWVMRKQDRTKRAPREDEVSVQGTYYVVGENIYQAPSVYDIVGNHLLSAMTSLNKFMDEATSLPIFTPALGYTYTAPAPAKSTTQATQTSASLSRENSPPPQSQQPTRSASAEPGTRSSSILGSTATQSAGPLYDPRDSLLLEQSFFLMRDHGDEFMDENPLRGEPGNFVFTHTKDRVKAKQAEAEAAAQRQREKQQSRADKDKEREGKSSSATPAAAPAVFSTKMELDGPDKEGGAGAAGKSRKGSKGDGTSAKKRRKSRVAVSPTTTNPSSPVASGTPRGGP